MDSNFIRNTVPLFAYGCLDVLSGTDERQYPIFEFRVNANWSVYLILGYMY